DAAVVYYGSSPDTTLLGRIAAPVLGLYGGDDERVNATIPAAKRALDALGRTYDVHIFEGAGHGFLRQQNGRDGANMEATRQAWPLTIEFFRKPLTGSARESAAAGGVRCRDLRTPAAGRRGHGSAMSPGDPASSPDRGSSRAKAAGFS